MENGDLSASEITSNQLSDRMYDLLLKNVSKDQPLTPSELEELKDFRQTLSDDRWAALLKFARREKKRLTATVNQFVDLPKMPSTASNWVENEPLLPEKNAISVASGMSSEKASLQKKSIFHLTNPFQADAFDAMPHSNLLSSAPAAKLNEYEAKVPVSRLEDSYPQYAPVPKTAIARQTGRVHQALQDCPEGVSLKLTRHGRSISAPRGAHSKTSYLQASQQSTQDLHRSSSPAPPVPSRQHPSTSASVAGFIPANRQGTPMNSVSPYSFHEVTSAETRDISALHPAPPPPPPPPPRVPTAASPLESVLAPFDPRVVANPSLSSGQVDAELRHSLVEAAELARLGSSRIDAAYSAAEHLLRTFSKPRKTEDAQDTKEIVAEMMACLDKVRSSLHHLEESAATSLPAAAEKMTSNQPIQHPMSFNDLQLGDELASSEVSSEWDDIQRRPYSLSRDDPKSSIPTEESYRRFTPYKPASPWKLSLRERADGVNSFAYESNSSEHPFNEAAIEREELDALNRIQEVSLNSSTQKPFPLGGDIFPSRLQRGKVYSVQQGAVYRVCIVQGPLTKAFEEFPIRADLESSSLDVVWREPRIVPSGVAKSSTPGYAASTVNSNRKSYSLRKGLDSRAVYGLENSASSSNASQALSTQILRRERFFFDQVLAGSKGMSKLRALVRQHARHSLQAGQNLVCICTGCGESSPTEVEPSVTLSLGSAGGSGIVSAILDEVFKFMSSSNHPGDSFSTASHLAFAAPGVAQMRRLNRVAFSAVLISRGRAADLLNTSSSTSNGERVHIDFDPTTRHASLRGATWVDLTSTMDFERIVGLLLGRRAGWLEAIQRGQVDTSGEFAALGTWEQDPGYIWEEGYDSKPARVLSADNHGSLGAVDDISRTMLLVNIAVSCSTTFHRLPHRLTFRIVTPCGQNWAQPGFDLNALSEVLSCLPHDPPVSILQASPLTALLT
eukprot:scaffold2066_cov229-Ochromonas_danica.AAC.1